MLSYPLIYLGDYGLKINNIKIRQPLRYILTQLAEVSHLL